MVNAVFSWDKGLRIEVYVDGLLAKAAFKALQAQSQQIEAAFGQSLTWDELPQAKASRIAFFMPGKEARDNHARWAAQHEWLLTWGRKLADAVRPFAVALDAATLQNQIEE